MSLDSDASVQGVEKFGDMHKEEFDVGVNVYQTLVLTVFVLNSSESASEHLRYMSSKKN